MANRDVDPDDLDLLEPTALSGRRRVRQLLGLAEDAYDAAAELVRARDLARWATEH